MRQTVKAWMLILLVSVPASLAAGPLHDFGALLKALRQGKEVRAVIHYGKCRLVADNEEQEASPDAIGGMELSVFEYFAPGSVRNEEAFLVCSETKLIENPLGEGYVYNYVKIRIGADGSVKITARYLDPLTFEVIMDEYFYTEVADGKNNGGLFLFAG